MVNATLPVLMALSWVPVGSPPVQAPQKAKVETVRTAPTETITCPLTGEQIPSCCCPVNKELLSD